MIYSKAKHLYFPPFNFDDYPFVKFLFDFGFNHNFKKNANCGYVLNSKAIRLLTIRMKFAETVSIILSLHN